MAQNIMRGSVLCKLDLTVYFDTSIKTKDKGIDSPRRHKNPNVYLYLKKSVPKTMQLKGDLDKSAIIFG